MAWTKKQKAVWMKKWSQERRKVQGYRLLYDWEYIDPFTKQNIKVLAGTFVTQPFPLSAFRTALFPQQELLIPRAICRRAGTVILKEFADDLLMGHCLPMQAVNDIKNVGSSEL